MKILHFLRNGALVLACVGILCPQLAQASKQQAAGMVPETARPAATEAVGDVALSAGGTLRGVVQDQQGLPMPGVMVVVAKQQTLEPLVAYTDSEGHFTVSGLTGGLYLIGTQEGGALYRVWAERTAPPAAADQALVISGVQAVRGAGQPHPLRFLGNPWVLAAIVAAAIAIPLALDDDDAS